MLCENFSHCASATGCDSTERTSSNASRDNQIHTIGITTHRYRQLLFNIDRNEREPIGQRIFDGREIKSAAPSDRREK